MTFEGAVGVKRLDNPRLFSGDKILAGTLAGLQDPLFFFGVHASLISGHIAAQAVDDKAGGLGAVRRDYLHCINIPSWDSGFSRPCPTRRASRCCAPSSATMTSWPDRFGGLTLYTIPGFMDLQKG